MKIFLSFLTVSLFCIKSTLAQTITAIGHQKHNDFTTNDAKKNINSENDISTINELFAKSNIEYSNPLNKALINRKRTKKCFRQGVTVMDVGYGILNFPMKRLESFKSADNFNVSFMGPISLGFEYGTRNLSSSGFGSGGAMGISGTIGYTKAAARWTAPDFVSDINGNTIETNKDEGFDISTIRVLLNYAYHFSTTDKLDPYISVGGGVNIANSTSLPGTTSKLSTSVVTIYEILAGTRYYFSDNIGVFGEVGLSRALVNFGISVKLKK